MGRSVRVFVSSTCYDLAQVRRNLEEFIRSYGFEPVMSDSRDVAVPASLTKIEACKWMVETSDIFILIIGGRYGSQDDATGKSITNIEFDTASERQVPIYAFVDDEVLVKRETFANLKARIADGDLSEKEAKNIIGGKIEDLRVFDFVDYVDKTAEQFMFPFRQASDITNALRENWSLLLKSGLDSLKRGQNVAVPVHSVEPILSVEWLNDDGEPMDILELPSLSDISQDQLQKRLAEFGVTRRVCGIVETRGDTIIELLETREPQSLGLHSVISDPSDRVEAAQKYCRAAMDLLNLVEQDWDEFIRRYELASRVVAPNLRITNNGKAPALSPVITVIASDRTWFIDKSAVEHENLQLRPPSSHSILAIINIADHLDDAIACRAIQSVIPEPRRIGGLASFLSSSLLSAQIAYPQRIGGILPHITPRGTLFAQTQGRDLSVLGIDKLRHNFSIDLESDNNETRIVCALERGVSAYLEVYCHADNLPEPNRCQLRVVAV